MSSVELCPYFDAKNNPPAMVMLAISSAPGSASITPSKSEGWDNPPTINGTPTATITGTRENSKGAPRARYTSFTYLRMLIGDDFRIQSRSFSIHLEAVPDPNDPIMKRMKRNEVGDDWKDPDRA